MDLRQASYVLAVVDHGTFTAAAASVPVSQPALSQSIATLERELGTPLFHRIGRQVRLTPAGEAFVEPARRMLRDARIARAAVEHVAGLTGGHVDLVALPTLVVEPLVPIVGRFRRAHPEVRVRIGEPEGAEGIVDLVRNGSAELGLGDTAPDDPLLTFDPLGRQALLAVLPPGTEVRTKRLHIERLAQLPLVTTPPGTSTRRLLAEALRREDPDADLQIAVVSDHREAIVPLVLAGAGAALLPEPAARAAAERGAVVVPIEPAVRRDVVLVRRTGPLSPAADAFRRVALELPRRTTTSR